MYTSRVPYDYPVYKQDLMLKPEEVKEKWFKLRNNYSGVTYSLFFEVLSGVAVDVIGMINAEGSLGPGVLVMVPKKSTDLDTFNTIASCFQLPTSTGVEGYPPETEYLEVESFSWIVKPASTCVVWDLVKYSSETGETVTVSSDMIESGYDCLTHTYESVVTWGVVVYWIYNGYDVYSLLWAPLRCNYEYCLYQWHATQYPNIDEIFSIIES